MHGAPPGHHGELEPGITDAVPGARAQMRSKGVFRPVREIEIA
jgi:hypothetical protein